MVEFSLLIQTVQSFAFPVRINMKDSKYYLKIYFKKPLTGPQLETAHLSTPKHH